MSFFLALPASLYAADVLQQVPRDALGFVVVRNIGQFDARATKLLASVQVGLPGPLAMFGTVTGVGTGIDPSGDLMLVVLPAENTTNDARQFHLAVWLPVKNYAVLVRSLEGDPERRMAAVTVAGEDLLAIEHDGWAVLADPDQRQRLEALAAPDATPPQQVTEWSDWLKSNDAALVVLPAGMKHAAAWALHRDDGPNGAADATKPAREQPIPLNEWAAIREWIRTATAAMPAATQWASQASSAACGLRLDAAGDAVIRGRLDFPEGFLPPASPGKNAPPQLYEGGDFVVHGGGIVNSAWAMPAVAPYIRSTANDLAAQFGVTVGEELLAQFQATVERAVADVQSCATLTLPGAKGEGVFTNSYLAVRVPSAEEFLSRVKEAMREWNAMLEAADGGELLVFEQQATNIAGRNGIEYSIDMAKVIGGADLPEARDAQEKLFGPGGRFRVQYVAVDNRTVLLAIVTEEQIAKLITVLDKSADDSAATPTDSPDLNNLLAREADWRFYFSPHGYFAWMDRQMHAIVGDVIGGPLVKAFPASPPIGAAGGVEGTVVWAEIAVPAETLRHAGEYARGN